MDGEDLDVCGIYPMEFQCLQTDMRRLESETNDLMKRIQRVYFATPYDQCKEFANKLLTLCETMKYMAERLHQMHDYKPDSWRHPSKSTPPTMQELSARREAALEYYRLQYEGIACQHADDAEDEIDANFSNVGL